VCKNPGHLLPGEAEEYKNLSGAELARIHMDFARRTFQGENDLTSEARRSTIFHKNLLRYVAHFLSIPQAGVFSRIAYTNLVKCSTRGERDPLQPKTMRECLRKHFVREIAYFRPKVLIAFGREVEDSLVGARIQRLHDLPVIYVKHPSYFYRREEERDILDGIKIEIEKLLGRPN